VGVGVYTGVGVGLHHGVGVGQYVDVDAESDVTVALGVGYPPTGVYSGSA
jgi:hypothetical protein